MQLKSTHLLKMTSGNEDLNCIHNCAPKHMNSTAMATVHMEKSMQLTSWYLSLYVFY
jgi:hypothetical protein